MAARKEVSLVVLLLSAAATIGCGSSRPVKYYKLTSPVFSSSPSTPPFPVTILVGRISAPHLYRDDRIVYATGPVRMGTYSYHRWAEPPLDSLEAMLIRVLRDSGRYRAVERLSSSTRGDYVVRGRLSALEEVDNREIVARFSIELELFELKSGTTVWTQSYSHDEPVRRKTVSAVVEALDRNVHAGLERLAESLAQYFASRRPE